MIDLLVAGGGPAGLATALYARQAGLHVAVAEPRRGPIDKACGEGLMPGGVRALRALNVPIAGHTITGITYLDARCRADADFPNGFGCGIRRTELQTALHTAALARGIRFHELPLREVVHHADRVSVNGIQARYLVAADGLHSALRHAVDPGAGSRTGHAARRFGIRAHFSVAPWTDRVEVYWVDSAEAYVTPVAVDLVGVAVLGEQRGSFADRLAAFPQLRARLPAHPVTAPRGAGPLRQRVRRHVNGRVLLVGDAAGYVDALTGEGLSLAFAQAAAAVARLAVDDPAGYEADYRRVTRRYRWLTEALLAAAAHRWARRHIVPTAAAFPGVFSAAVATLGG